MIDKILPIDSIYTIGTFYELVERIVMPTLIMDIENDATNTIQLEAWPFSVEMLCDTEMQFIGKQASQFIYHLYDTSFRLFNHLTEDMNEVEGEDSHEVEEGRDAPIIFENVPLEIVIDPEAFNIFFESPSSFSQAVYEDFCQIEQRKGESDTINEQLIDLSKKIFEV